MAKVWIYIGLNYLAISVIYNADLTYSKTCEKVERIDNKDGTYTVRSIKTCCSGYKKTLAGCIECSDGYYGENCTNRCECFLDHSTSNACDKETGHCLCKPGWIGKDCFETCPEYTYGVGCANKCDCVKLHTQYCHHVSGRCICKPMWGGERCGNSRILALSLTTVRPPTTCLPGFGSPGCQKCTNLTYGPECSQKCPCVPENTASCDHILGKTCTCKDGYIGNLCADKCSAFYYGKDCKSKCKCNTQQATSCDHTNGQCSCKAGWGPAGDCTKACTDFTYGVSCSSNCTCLREYTSSCNQYNGICFCNAGRDGTTCEKVCAPWTYGLACYDRACECDRSKSESCDPVTGACNCKAGYTGVTCTQTCSAWKYGPNCVSNCTCVQSNTERCNGTDGTCTCSAGWDGNTCSDVCSGFKYGANCSLPCNCPSTAYPTCHHITGVCTCLPGYYGNNCQHECANGTFGSNCLGICKCNPQNTLSCGIAIGDCKCKDGFTGSTCNEIYILSTTPAVNDFLLMTWLHLVLAVGGTILIFLLIVFVCWQCLKCTCRELNERLCHKSDGEQDHIPLKNEKGASNMEMNSINGGKKKAEGDSQAISSPEYYYSSDLKSADIKSSKPAKAEPGQEYYYAADLKSKGEAVAPPPAANATPTQDEYYTDSLPPPPPVDSLPRSANPSPRIGPKTPKGSVMGETYTDAFTPPPPPPNVTTLPNAKKGPAEKPAYYTDAFTPPPPALHKIPSKQKLLGSNQDVYQNLDESGKGNAASAGKPSANVQGNTKPAPTEPQKSKPPPMQDIMYESLDVDDRVTSGIYQDLN